MTTLASLVSTFRRRIGDNVSGSWKYQPDEIMEFLVDALDGYNSCPPSQKLEILGSGDDRYLNPTPGEDDRELYLFFAELAEAESSYTQAIRISVSRTSPLASVDLRDMARNWRSRVQDIRKKIEVQRDKMADPMLEAESRHMSISDPDDVKTVGTSTDANDSTEIILGGD